MNKFSYNRLLQPAKSLHKIVLCMSRSPISAEQVAAVARSPISAEQVAAVARSPNSAEQVAAVARSPISAEQVAAAAGGVMVKGGRWWGAVKTGGVVAYAYCIWHTVTTHIVSCIFVSGLNSVIMSK